MLKMTTILRKWVNSIGVRLPKNILNEALLSENERVELVADKTGVRVQKLGKPETLDDLFKGYSGNYEYCEFSVGNPVGTEVW